MAGPSGAGMVNAYLRQMGSSRRRGQAVYRAALRRELAKSGRGDPEMAPFPCFLLCMTCGHLQEPASGDPMRTDAEQKSAPRICSSCGDQALADLRHTPTAYSLGEFDEEVESSKRGHVARIVARTLTVGAAIALTLAVAWGVSDQVAALPIVPLTIVAVVGIPLIATAIRRLANTRKLGGGRRLPRRWRLPRLSGGRLRKLVQGTAVPNDELLRAPISGRPCLAYEVAVRTDASPTESMSSWRMVEQRNTSFSVDDVQVRADGASLMLDREMVCDGTPLSFDESQRQYLRRRGILETETVHVFESILEPGSECRIDGEGSGEGPVRVSS